MERRASVKWTGSLKEGGGKISMQSGVLKDSPYSYATRFDSNPGTNPEELIGAAHAACFSMALSAELGKASLAPDEIKTDATVKFERQGEGFAITQSHLDVFVHVAGGDRSKIEQALKTAKENCPVSKVLRAEITMKSEIQT
jgi:osmotically inducible protein OsmC